MSAAASAKAERARRSQETSDLILAEAAGLLAEQGLDRCSAIALAQRCGMSTGPIYSRYDTPEDVAVDLWQHALDPALAGLLDLLSHAAKNSDSAIEQLAAELTRPRPVTAAICELVAVARRYPQLAEQIRGDLVSRLRAHCAAQPELPPAMAIGQVSFFLGGVMLAPVVAPEPTSRWRVALGLIAELGEDTAARGVAPVDSRATVMPMPEPTAGDPLQDDLAKAVMAVVARVGYERATATRIARQAQRGFSTFYGHFASKDECLVSVVTALIDQIIGISVRGFVGAGREEFIAASVANARGLVADENRENRHLRVETMIAARHYPEIADVAGRLYAAVQAEIEQALGANAPAVSRERANAYWALVRSNSIGMSLLATATPFLDDVDWTPASAGLFGLLERTGGATAPS